MPDIETFDQYLNTKRAREAWVRNLEHQRKRVKVEQLIEASMEGVLGDLDRQLYAFAKANPLSVKDGE